MAHPQLLHTVLDAVDVRREAEFWRALLGVIILTLVLAFPLGLVGSVARFFGNRRAQP